MRKIKKPALPHLFTDLAIIVSCLYLSLFLRLGRDELGEHIGTFHQYLPMIIVIRLGVNWLLGVYQIMWRYVSIRDAFNLARALAVSSMVIIAFSFFVFDRFGQLPRTIYMIDWVLVTMGLLGARLYRRLRYESRRTGLYRGGIRTVIYGAGIQGRTLAQRFNTDTDIGVDLVGFIDDDPQKSGVRIEGYSVLGNSKDLEEILRERQIEQLIVAIDSFSREKLHQTLQICYVRSVRVKTLSSLRYASAQAMDLYRDISLSDLLNRPAREIDLQPVRQMIQGKRVLVTGAGGSIGSELARQIMSHNPEKLLLLDHSEYHLYNIDKELRINSSVNSSKVVPLLVDIKDEKSLFAAIAPHSPQVIFHAAAYKHVHLVESNPLSAILNNVLGTHLLLKISKMLNTESFVMISTDKAVNPVGVMGATKRV